MRYCIVLYCVYCIVLYLGFNCVYVFTGGTFYEEAALYRITGKFAEVIGRG